jgi:glycosyltransferase involved in cell wall biosynthesis
MNLRNHNVKVSAFTGRFDDPASYFRFRQLYPKLRSEDLIIKEYMHPCYYGCWHRGPLKVIPYLKRLRESYDSDVTWLSRTLVVGLETIELLLKRPRVMDVDDSIWLAKPYGILSIPHLARHMDVIVAGNNYLAEWFGKYCKEIHVLPTSIDVDRYKVKDKKESDNRFVIGWTGGSVNYPFLTSIEKPLARFLKDHKDVFLKILADRPWPCSLIPENKMIFTRWSREVEVEELYEMSLGIMPLVDSVWARGKCSLKMLQYMAIGLPVVVSPVGMNNDVLSKGDVGFAADSDNQWYEAFDTLYKNESLRTQMGIVGRKIIEEHYNADKIAGETSRILRKTAGTYSS